ncbi:MAG: helix-turn-helix transcriptional regulator [Coriobacteriales bacterium]|nr:helix-turn-helix transcriptional regulator [Coriobacteriales bacterium]
MQKQAVQKYVPKTSELPWLLMATPYLLDREMFLIPSIDWPSQLWILQSPYWGFLLVCVLCAVFFNKSKDAEARQLVVFDVLSGIFMAAGVLLVHALAFGPSAVAVFIGMSLCGAGAAWQYVRWGQCCVRISLERSIMYICWAFVLAELIKSINYLLPVIRPEMNIFFAGFGVFALRWCLKNLEGQYAERMPLNSEPVRLADIWLVPVSIVLLSCLVGVMLSARFTTFGSSGGLQILLGNAVEVVATVAVWFWVCVKERSLSIVIIIAVMAAVMATSCTLLITLENDAANVAYLLTSIDYGLLNLFVWILLVAIALKSASSAGAVLAVGWAVRSLPVLCAGAFSKLVHLTLGPGTCAVLMYVACMTLVAVIFGRNVSITGLFNSLDAQVPEGKAGLAQKCKELTESYRLTSREAEVLELLARGRTRAYIAESLCISENTVRVYTTKIYNKLDIHDRSSLFILVYGSADGMEQTSESDSNPIAGH